MIERPVLSISSAENTPCSEDAANSARAISRAASSAAPAKSASDAATFGRPSSASFCSRSKIAIFRSSRRYAKRIADQMLCSSNTLFKSASTDLRSASRNSAGELSCSIGFSKSCSSSGWRETRSPIASDAPSSLQMRFAVAELPSNFFIAGLFESERFSR